jgi:hypothetical protein
VRHVMRAPSTTVTVTCEAGQRCRGFTVDGPAPATRTPLCDACLVWCADNVWRLLTDWEALEQALPRGGGAGELVSGTRELPIPIRQNVEALQAEILHVTTTWERVVRDWRDLSPHPTGRVRDGFAVQRAVGLLRANVEELAKIPSAPVQPAGPTDPYGWVSGAAGLVGMSRLHGRAFFQLGLTEFTNSLPGECSACGLAELATADGGARTALARPDGSDTVFCRSCGDRRTRDDYEVYALRMATGYVARRRTA